MSATLNTYVVEELNVTENGTYEQTGKLFSPVNVNVSGWTTDVIAQNTGPSGDIVLGNGVTTIGSCAFYNKPITSISAPSVTSVGRDALRGTKIKYISPSDFPSFAQDSSGTRIIFLSYMPELLEVKLTGYVKLDDGTSVCKSNPKLVKAEFPNASSALSSASFRDNPLLELVDLGEVNSIANNAFYSDTALRTLILRRTSVVSLNSWTVAVLGGIYSNPTSSTIYVPETLISSYQTATNWSSAYAAGVTFAKIEGSVYEL